MNFLDTVHAMRLITAAAFIAGLVIDASILVPLAIGLLIILV